MKILIRFYQKAISPYLPKACRYEPTCSEYAYQCYERFSFFKATKLMVLRVLRCNPFGSSGFDPVPLNEERCCSSHHHSSKGQLL